MLQVLTIVSGIVAVFFGLFAVLATLLARTGTDKESSEDAESLSDLREYARVLGNVARYATFAFAMGFVILLVFVAS
jgi:hypothetical protein